MPAPHLQTSRSSPVCLSVRPSVCLECIHLSVFKRQGLKILNLASPFAHAEHICCKSSITWHVSIKSIKIDPCWNSVFEYISEFIKLGIPNLYIYIYMYGILNTDPEFHISYFRYFPRFRPRSSLGALALGFGIYTHL